MFAGIYRDFVGKSDCGDFKFTGIACIPAIPVIFEVNQKKVRTFYIYSLVRFFKFPYNFCGYFSRTCNPCDNYMHFTGYVLRQGDPPHFLWGKICSVANILLFYILWTTRSITIKCCASIINTLAGTLLHNHNRFKSLLKEHSSFHGLAFPCKDKADKDPYYHTKILIFSFTWADLAAFHKSDKI